MPPFTAINTNPTRGDNLQRTAEMERINAAVTLLQLHEEDCRIHREIQEGLTRSITSAKAAIELKRSMTASLAEDYSRNSKRVKLEFRNSEPIDEATRQPRLRLIAHPPTREQLQQEADFLATQNLNNRRDDLPVSIIKDTNPRKSAPTESFGFNLKRWLNSLSDLADNQKASDYAPYEQVIASYYPNTDPAIQDREYDGDVKKARNAPTGNDYGDPSTLKPYEINLCHKLKITYAQYRCAKARLFIGLACFVEYNSRGLDDIVPKRPHQIPATGFKPVGFKVSQGQVCSKLDGNVTGPLTKVFLRWGWIDESLVEKDIFDDQIRVRDDLERKFPGVFRTELFRKLIAWENSAENRLRDEQKFAFRRLDE